MIVVNNTAAPANSGSGAAAKIGIIGRCPKFFAGRVCYTPSGAPETPPIGYILTLATFTMIKVRM